MQQKLDQSLASLNISLRDHNLRYIQFGKQTLYLEQLGTQDLKSIRLTVSVPLKLGP